MRFRTDRERDGAGSGQRGFAALAVMLLVASGPIDAAGQQAGQSLSGTWTLVAADKQLPDGTRVKDYGENPQGRMMIDGDGRYSTQIFRSERPNFAAGDKARGTDSEYRDAVMGSSTNYGAITVDWTSHVLRVTFDESSYPNLRGQVQMRPFELTGDTLSYRVAARPDGSVPISVWRRDR